MLPLVGRLEAACYSQLMMARADQDLELDMLCQQAEWTVVPGSFFAPLKGCHATRPLGGVTLSQPVHHVQTSRSPQVTDDSLGGNLQRLISRN